MPDEGAYQSLSNAIDPFEVGNRTRSAALLSWFLETVWRLDPAEVEDSICDGGGDKGIDGIVVDDDQGEITIFQSWHRDEGNTVGDAKQRQFYGVAPYFASPDGLQGLLDSGPNEELRNLIARLELPAKLADANHSVRLVFVSNVPADQAGSDYAETLLDGPVPYELWTQDRLGAIAVRNMHPGLLDVDIDLQTDGYVYTDLGNDVSMVLALVSATELLDTLPGIDDLTVFDLNVRLGLGNTRINRELAGTIRQEDEHALFPAFHNGLTLLTNRLDQLDEGKLHLHGVSVVNGCQSLLALHSNSNEVTPDLRVIVKIVDVVPGSGLEAQVTYRANNQNPVNIRDQRSTHAIQLDLQQQVSESYGDSFFYSIRQGEVVPDGAEVFDNRLAAQIIMAVWLEEPWAAVRKLRLFDAEYHRVFTRRVDAHTLRLAFVLDQVIQELREELPPELVSSFASVRFTIAYLVARLVAMTPLGDEFLAAPGRWLPEAETEVRDVLATLTSQVISSIDLYLEDRKEQATEDDPFDPKVVFKSSKGVRDLRGQTEGAARLIAKEAEKRSQLYGFHIDPRR